MSFTLGEISRFVKGTCHGDPGLIIEEAAIIRDAGKSAITLLDKEELLDELNASEACAVICPESMSPECCAYVTVADVHTAFGIIADLFHPRTAEGQQGVSPQASVDPTATLGQGVTIFPNCYVGPDCTIGDNVTLHSGVSILAGSTVGSNTTIFPNAVLYELTEVGSNCIIHANAVVGAYGFGYDSSTGKHILSPQSGFVRIEDDVEIGAATTIDRGTYGATVIGQGSKLDNQVMVAHNCVVGKHNLLCSQVGIAGSCTTGDYVVMAGQVGIGDHINIGHKTILGAKAGVMSDVPSDVIFVGIPATPHREQLQKQAAFAKLPEMRKQFKQMQKDMKAVQAQLEAPSKNEAA